MPVPDFSPGEVLTAAAMDSIGLWRVGGGALSGSTTVFQSVFTDNYTNYRIIIDSPTLSATDLIYYRLYSGATPNTTSNYSYAFTGLTIGGAASNASFAAASAGVTGFSQNILNNVVLGSVVMDIYGPKLAQRTFATHQAALYAGAYVGRQGMSLHDVTTAFDGIGFMTLSATTMTGTVSIYGYRKA
jgi:hypothetical protein